MVFAKLLSKPTNVAFGWLFLILLSVSFGVRAFAFDFSYSGRLVDDTGKPFEGPLSLKVSFFHSATTTSPVLEITSGLGNVSLQDGVFQITMALDPQDFQTVFPSVSQAVYLQITDVTHGKSYDRQQISMLPYAGKIPVDGSVFDFDNNGLLSFAANPEAGKYLKGNADGSVTWDTPAGGVAASSTDTFTNKTINADNNTVTNIADTNIKAGAAIADSKLATISTAGKVSGAAITSGTIAGSTAVSTSGTIATTGKAGIGVAAGTSQLEVKGGGATSATSSLNVTDSAGSSKLFVRDDGNVGIGTTTPGATLELSGSNTPKLLFNATNTNSGYISLNSTTFDFVSAVSPGSFRFLGIADPSFPVVSINTGLGGNSSVFSLNNYLGTNKNLVVKAHASQTANITEWQNSAGTAMSVVDSTGRIGIGTTGPTAKLHVTNTGGGVIARFTGSSANLTLSESSGNYSLLNSSSSAGFTFGASNNITASGGVLNATTGMTVGANPYTSTSLLVTGKDSTSATAGLNVQNSSSTSLLYARSDGNVGIGNTGPSQRLSVGASGDGSVAIANSWTTYSDKRLKKDVSIIDNALEKISKLAGYFFYWKKGDDSSRQVGVMAQDVEEIFPEVVKTGSDGIKSVDYPKLVAPMIEAIKTLKHEVDELKKDNIAIKKQLCERDPDSVLCVGH